MLARQPFRLGSEPPSEDSEYGDGSEYDGRLGRERLVHFLMWSEDVMLTKLNVSAVTGKKNGETSTLKGSDGEGTNPRRIATYREHQSLEQGHDEVHRWPKLAEVVMATSEGLRGHCQTQEADESICSDSRNASGRDKGRESDVAGKDDEQDEGSEDVHNSNRITRLSVGGYLADPPREGKNTVSGDGKDESGSSHDGDTGILFSY